MSEPDSVSLDKPAGDDDGRAGGAVEHADGALLSLHGVTKWFRGLRAVDDVTFDIAPGTITALIGPNGAGKTTLFNVITGFLKADEGRITFGERTIANRSSYKIARRGLVRTFQIPRALAAMSVLDNMMLAAPNQPGERLLLMPAIPRVRRREREVRDNATELLESFGLADKRDDYAGTLSGGQRKLLELARALMTEPRAVLLDEPMAGVNPTLGRRLLEHMARLRSDNGTTFVFVEHDMDVVMNHSDRVLVMAEGQLIADGEPAAVRKDPAVIEAYLGSPAGEPAGES